MGRSIPKIWSLWLVSDPANNHWPCWQNSEVAKGGNESLIIINHVPGKTLGSNYFDCTPTKTHSLLRQRNLKTQRQCAELVLDVQQFPPPARHCGACHLSDSVQFN